MTKNHIAGEWLAAAKASPNISPSNTSAVVGEYARASAIETERAIGAASDAFPARSHSAIQARHDIPEAAALHKLQGLVIDDAVKAGTNVGPVADESQLEQDLQSISIGQAEGAKLIAGGKLLKREAPGFYLAPALLAEREQQDSCGAQGDFRAFCHRDLGQGL
ncbi:hypothetical protein BCCGELA001_29140 [Bradyrhizobium sp. CCGE-LA001]|nr:hypothetical protein BCCGELA001_29140 [Bradyrhizobium sp. CCGE-LA001]